MTVYLGKNPVGVGRIVEKKVAKTKFGATVDTWVGDVDTNGKLNPTTWTGPLNFAGVKSVGSNSMFYTFYNCVGITSVNFSSLQSVESRGLISTFFGCKGIISVDLSSLQTVGNNGMYNTFCDCTGITSVDFSSLQTVGNNGLISAFYGCKGITKISFPSLTSITTGSFGTSSGAYIFHNCTNLTEIHFRADMQATIEAMTGYSSKWGATNATIFFDL